jgi:hypothetical protein
MPAMKKTFECGHSDKGQFCHTCAAIAKANANAREERERKREAKRQAAANDVLDLSIVDHLATVQREARELLVKVSNGVHPYALKGKALQSTRGQVLSVPVGRSYRLLFDAPTLTPLRLVSHEAYNTIADSRLTA